MKPEGPIKRVILVRHGDDPPDDRVTTFLLERGFEPVLRKPFAGDSLGEIDGTIAGSVIYGGRYNAYGVDEHPFLKEEYRWIAACLDANVPLLGICLGAQQIAWHLGAEVGPAPGDPCEFGYYEITPTADAGDFLAAPLTVTQSHFHTFSIPDGATRLASSAMFPNQAFRYGEKVYALQFHPEVTSEGFRRAQQQVSSFYSKPGAQSRDDQDALMVRHDPAQADWFEGFLGKLFGAAR